MVDFFVCEKLIDAEPPNCVSMTQLIGENALVKYTKMFSP